MRINHRKKSRLLCALVVATSALSACGFLDDAGGKLVSGIFGDEDHYLENVPSRLVVDKLWSKSIGKGFEESYLVLSPLLADDRIYTCDRNGRVTAFSVDDGDKIWSRKLDLDVSFGVAGDDGLLLIGTAGGEVVALSPEAGKEAWRRRLNTEITAISSPHRGRVLVRTADSRIFSLSAATGRQRWKRKDKLPPLTLKGASIPVFHDTAAFIGLADGRLLVLDVADGRVLREMKLGIGTGRTDLDRIVDIDGRMVIRDGFFYATAYQGRTIAVDLDRGKLLWTQDVSSHTGLDVDDRAAYVVTADNVVTALDRVTGAELWSNDDLLNTELSAPTRVAGFVIVGSDRGDLYWLSRKSGTVLERTRIASEPVAGMLGAERNRIVVLDQGGDLTAVQLKAYRKNKR